ncbi:hypothetical protein E2C01_075899 [Portunus trituberculatus]|uniref:Uncharacterized protein n=1 Tax=Portunus trituberculatus TaxID=210409 RepID=A0A5B7IBV4_PORTR|nr:hypothetical protein [Portunus trituberculatus]
MNQNNYYELILDELDECMEKCNVATHSTTIGHHKEKMKIGLKMARSDYVLAHGCLGACDTDRGQGSDWLAGPLHHTDPGPT